MAVTLVKTLNLTCCCGGKPKTVRQREFHGETLEVCCSTCGRLSESFMVKVLDMYGYDRLLSSWADAQRRPSPRAGLGCGEFWYDADGKKIGNW